MPVAHRPALISQLRAAVWAGLIAGLTFLGAELALVALSGGSIWGPPRMMAAIVLGRGVLPPPARFDPGVVSVGMAVHCVLSLSLAIVWSLLARRWSAPVTLAAGAAFGLVVYLVDFYGFTALFPWFENARGAVTITSHLVFGMVLASVYALRRAD